MALRHGYTDIVMSELGLAPIWAIVRLGVMVTLAFPYSHPSFTVILVLSSSETNEEDQTKED